jgi:hypothetical protein
VSVSMADVHTGVCVECLIGKQKKPILFKVTEPRTCILVTGVFVD